MSDHATGIHDPGDEVLSLITLLDQIQLSVADRPQSTRVVPFTKECIAGRAGERLEMVTNRRMALIGYTITEEAHLVLNTIGTAFRP